MTPEDHAWIAEQQRRLAGTPTLEDHLRGWPQPQPPMPTFQGAWASISALNMANDRLRWERDVALRSAQQWRWVAYMAAVVGLLWMLMLGIVLIWGR